MSQFTESVVEDAALQWFEQLGYTLLPKLLSGEIRIKDAEKIVGVAT